VKGFREAKGIFGLRFPAVFFPLLGLEGGVQIGIRRQTRGFLLHDHVIKLPRLWRNLLWSAKASAEAVLGSGKPKSLHI